jgi:nucleoside-diphosphate kinase
MEQSLVIIKPNVVHDRKIGEIISMLENNGLIIKQMKMESLERERIERFYEIHRDRPFFVRLINYMTSGPVVELVVEGENCIEFTRKLIGDTDPQIAAEGTIRKKYGRNVTENAVHASDSVETARREIKFMFDEF